MFDAEWSLDGFDGSWHYVRQVSGCDRMRELLTGAGVMSDRQARDFLDAGDGQFSAVNPRDGGGGDLRRHRGTGRPAQHVPQDQRLTATRQ